MRNTRSHLAAALLGAALALTACATPSGGEAPRGPAKAPDFSLRAVDGSTVRLSDYLGQKVVLVDFWATWCTPCLGELPHLEALYQKYKDQGLTVLAVDMDGPESLANVEPTVRRYGLSFPVLLDEETRVVAQYNPARDAPFAVLIDRGGEIVERRAGYAPGDEVSLEARVKALLGGAESKPQP